MINLKTERIAVHNCASIFSDFGWVFREQTIGDFGIDAIVETTINNKPSGKLIAIQIKGGNSNFYETNSSLTFYFSESHYVYWSNHILPVFIILQDSNNKMLWQIFSTKHISKTKTRWKITIPKTNILEESKKIIDKIATKKTKNKVLKKIDKESKETFKYFLGENNSLCLSVKEGNINIDFDFNYMPKKNWNNKLERLHKDDPHYYSIKNFEDFLIEKINKKENDIELTALKMIGGNIENLTENLFNLRNYIDEIPEYHKFIEAFENYSKLDKSKYKAIVIEDSIHIETGKNIYEIYTFESREKQIKYYLEGRFYEEILAFTSFSAWSEIYEDHGIFKHEFIPIFLREWDLYWEKQYEFSDKLKTPKGYVDELKNNCLIKFDKFSDLYGETNDVIELAFDFDCESFYPIAVITMYTILGSDILSQYSELEFESEEWIAIPKTNDENWEYEPMFFLREI